MEEVPITSPEKKKTKVEQHHHHHQEAAGAPDDDDDDDFFNRMVEAAAAAGKEKEGEDGEEGKAGGGGGAGVEVEGGEEEEEEDEETRWYNAMINQASTTSVVRDEADPIWLEDVLRVVLAQGGGEGNMSNNGGSNVAAAFPVDTDAKRLMLARFLGDQSVVSSSSLSSDYTLQRRLLWGLIDRRKKEEEEEDENKKCRFYIDNFLTPSAAVAVRISSIGSTQQVFMHGLDTDALLYMLRCLGFGINTAGVPHWELRCVDLLHERALEQYIASTQGLALMKKECARLYVLSPTSALVPHSNDSNNSNSTHTHIGAKEENFHLGWALHLPGVYAQENDTIFTLYTDRIRRPVCSIMREKATGDFVHFTPDPTYAHEEGQKNGKGAESLLRLLIAKQRDDHGPGEEVRVWVESDGGSAGAGAGAGAGGAGGDALEAILIRLGFVCLGEGVTIHVTKS